MRDQFFSLLGVAVLCLAGCAATAPESATQTSAAAPAPVETLGISLSWEVALEEVPSVAARAFLDLEGRPEELPLLLSRIMDEAAVAVADELPSSPAVRWVLTSDNPRLTPDHTLHLTLLRFEVQLASNTERIFSPKIKLRAFLSSMGSAGQRLTTAFTVTSKQVLRGPGEKRPLDLTAFYSEVAAALRFEIEEAQAGSR